MNTDKFKEWLKITIGVLVIIAGAFGITDFTLPEPWNTFVKALVAILLALWQRSKPSP